MADQTENPLYTATERLISALDRLEVGLQDMTLARSRDVQQHEQITSFERENKTLRAEQEQLYRSIEDLQQQYVDLQGTTSSIYHKLEDSIKRLTQIVGS
ncbi:MAG: hypothetical protein SFT92_06910 [Rickettsiales bacterium]|nr:hypothetical protein [Rickettsiales bacterium]